MSGFFEKKILEPSLEALLGGVGHLKWWCVLGFHVVVVFFFLTSTWEHT